MPAERLSMRQIREVLRLCFESRLPQRAVARSHQPSCLIEHTMNNAKPAVGTSLRRGDWRSSDQA
jgi:hypothetical protein